MNNYLAMDYQFVYLEDYQDFFDQFIEEEQNIFLGEIKLDNEKGSTYRISYDVYFYHDIASIHFVLYTYQGGAHDIRYDKVIYYGLDDHKKKTLDDIISNKQEFLEKISIIAKHQLLNEKKELIYEDSYLFQDGLDPIDKNYQYLVFDQDSLKIIFPPYQVGPWSSGEINATIPYLDIARLMKL